MPGPTLNSALNKLTEFFSHRAESLGMGPLAKVSVVRSGEPGIESWGRA